MSKIPLQGITKAKLTVVPTKRRMMNHWSLGLLSAMEDPELIISQDDETVTIRDRYPKAKYHYLILPKTNICTIFSLDESHLPLLNHMYELATKLKSEHDINFKIGFHSVPNMQQLHLHVISDDFVSRHLKTRIHWNSYTTEFFMPFEKLVNMIKRNGKVTHMNTYRAAELLNTPLSCHKCSFQPSDLSKLKEHLPTHL